MRHAQVYYSLSTGELTVIPGWPPTPSEGDRWVKPASKRRYSRDKHLERTVTEVNGWRLNYEDQSGQVRECSTDAFRKWTDDCRAIPKKLSHYTLKKVVCGVCEGVKEIGSQTGKSIVCCWNCRGDGKILVVAAKKRHRKAKQAQKARKRKKVRA
jgi:hypothetical protein